MRRKHTFFQDRYIPSRQKTEQEKDIQSAMLDGLFDAPSCSAYNDHLCYELLGMSYQAIHNSSLLQFRIKPSIPKTDKKRGAPLLIEKNRALDAPNMTNDFYYNVLSWGKSLYIGLGAELYGYRIATGQVNLIQEESMWNSSISSISSHSGVILRNDDSHISTISEDTNTLLRALPTDLVYHCAVPADNASFYMISRDSGDITSNALTHYDTRTALPVLLPFPMESALIGLTLDANTYKLAFSTEAAVYLFDSRRLALPVHKLVGHNTSTSKALAFSPDTAEYLASGGGSADRTVKIWNTQTGNQVADAAIGAQVCNLHWLNKESVFVTEGFSSNRVSCWTMVDDKLVLDSSDNAHTNRVLSSVQNPSNPNELVTGSPDETLRFWSIMNNERPTPKFKHDGLSLVGMPAFR